MFALIALSFVCALCMPSDSRAAEGSTGLGVILGEPTGLSFKQWVGTRHAFDIAAAWSFADNGAFHIHADYLWHFFDRIDRVESGSIPLYVGVGGRIKFNDNDDDVGVRVPLGIDFILADAPIDFFLEVVPILDLVPDTDFEINAALGARFWFD